MVEFKFDPVSIFAMYCHAAFGGGGGGEVEGGVEERKEGDLCNDP